MPRRAGPVPRLGLAGGMRPGRRGCALCAPPPAAPPFLGPAGGGPRPRARQPLGALFGVGQAPAGALAVAAAPAVGPALRRAVLGAALWRGRLCAALLAVHGHYPGHLPAHPGAAPLAVDWAGAAVRRKAAAAQRAGARPGRPCVGLWAPGVAVRSRRPLPPASRPRGRRRRRPALRALSAGRAFRGRHRACADSRRGRGAGSGCRGGMPAGRGRAGRPCGRGARGGGRHGRRRGRCCRRRGGPARGINDRPAARAGPAAAARWRPQPPARRSG